MHDTISVPLFEAKNRLSALLAEVARGTEVVTTNRGVPVARLVPANTEAERRERARRAVAGIKRVSKGFGLGGLKIKDLTDEGRP
ncbi:MAG: type II toxin-antitoxin system prevent-host-death family antitoxin [Acetobacteraceae bacterium]|nr:type II toxin-antitoxin system prevent-host-death family antitoxin [Acetobacteraceae bacterium]